jgi:hypothetical protein
MVWLYKTAKHSAKFFYRTSFLARSIITECLNQRKINITQIVTFSLTACALHQPAQKVLCHGPSHRLSISFVPRTLVVIITGIQTL